jgi:predicted nucleic acid-binding protein
VRIVLDSNILVRSFARPGGLASGLLLAILDGDHTLVLSNEMISEVARVLRYPRLAAAHGQSEEAIYNFTGWLRDAAEIVALNPLAVADAQRTRIRESGGTPEPQILRLRSSARRTTLLRTTM